MALFHPIETDLNFMDAKSFGHLLGHQCAIGEENRSKIIFLEEIVDLPEMGVKQRLPSGEEESQPLDLFKFFEYPLNLFFRKILMGSFRDITMAAPEIASIGDLKFKITERRDGGWIQGYLSLRRSF